MIKLRKIISQRVFYTDLTKIANSSVSVVSSFLMDVQNFDALFVATLITHTQDIVMDV